MAKRHTIKVAIDGPAGAGKTTISRELARHFEYVYIDTGAMYRAIALKTVRKNLLPDDISAIADMLENTDVMLNYNDNVQKVFLDGEDISEKIRVPEISGIASDVSALLPVRKKMVDLQRKMAAHHDVIMDGRDIGTYVLPHANIKIFLTATTEDRAHRRFRELEETGVITTIEDVRKDIMRRDKNDSSRDIAPLMVASDAIIVDTSDNTLQQSITILREIIQERLHEILQQHQENS
jgi:cytidylate kinase